jgi:hypothetical protein
MAYAQCCPGALSLENLEQEKAAFYTCSPGAFGLHGFEQEEESLMDVYFEQPLACLK